MVAKISYPVICRCTKVLNSECVKETGENPIIVRWIDVNNNDVDQPNYRSRLLAIEINTSKREDLFAVTPPLEALNVILSSAASSNKREILNVVHGAINCAHWAPDGHQRLTL